MSDQIADTILRDIAHSVVVPGNRVVRSAEIAHIGGRPATRKGSPSIEVVMEKDIVRAIDVTCECGKTIRLWCSYENDAESKKVS